MIIKMMDILERMGYDIRILTNSTWTNPLRSNRKIKIIWQKIRCKGQRVKDSRKNSYLAEVTTKFEQMERRQTDLKAGSIKII